MTDYFDNWFFTTDKTSQQCPKIAFTCAAPNACARDPATGRSYCCDAGATSVCWTGSTNCMGDGSTFSCGSGTTNWCCLANGREKCTETRNQINICWSTAHDTLRNVSVASLEVLQSSLASRNPAASSLTFAPTDLIAATRTSAVATTSTINTASSPTVTSSTSNGSPAATSTDGSAAGSSAGSGSGDSSSSSPSSSSSLSPGALAGVVIGVVAALAIIAVAGILLWRRARNKDAKSPTSEPGEMEGSSVQHQPSPFGNSSGPPLGSSEMPTYAEMGHIDEYYGGSATAKTPGSAFAPSELGSAYSDNTAVIEMPTPYNEVNELPAHPQYTGGGGGKSRMVHRAHQ